MEWCSTKIDQESIGAGTVRNWNPPLSDRLKEAETVRLLSYGDCIVPGEYFLHSRFRRAGNFLCGENLISIVDRTIGGGPFNLVVDGYENVTADSVMSQQDSFTIGGVQLICDKALRYNSTIKIPPHTDPRKLQENLRYCKEILKERAPCGSLVFLFDESQPSSPEISFENILLKRSV